jgi:hypothetical protein
MAIERDAHLLGERRLRFDQYSPRCHPEDLL